MITAGFNPKSNAAPNLDKDQKEGGLLILTKDDKKFIKGSMDNLSNLQKFQDICSYRFEFGYDLAICPSLNVSQSPGYEAVLGIFGGEE